MGVKMLKKVIICLAIVVSFQTQYAQCLDVTETTTHFTWNFSADEKDTIHPLMQEMESFYSNIAHDFSYTSDRLVTINVYPDIQAFHDAIGLVDAPDWAVARATDEALDIVSLASPGPFHSQESINQIMKLNVVKSIIYDAFGRDNVPYWLAYGVGALKVGYCTSTPSLDEVPTLDQLECNHYADFKKVNGFQVSCSFVQFINDTYGWDAVLELLANYDANKVSYYQEWIEKR